jgi:3-deoxy-D-arabino-heptulosonate 7-phosphate (DAHP) synthase class II
MYPSFTISNPYLFIESSTYYIQAQDIALLFTLAPSPRLEPNLKAFLQQTACATTSKITKAQNKNIKVAPVVRITRMAGQYANPRIEPTARRLRLSKEIS